MKLEVKWYKKKNSGAVYYRPQLVNVDTGRNVYFKKAEIKKLLQDGKVVDRHLAFWLNRRGYQKWPEDDLPPMNVCMQPNSVELYRYLEKEMGL
jgi:hypothetical protein